MTRSLTRCMETRHFSAGATDVGEQCMRVAGHGGSHIFDGPDNEIWSSTNLAVLTQARWIFLRCLLAWHDSYSAMVARSYAEEKIDYAFRTTSIFDLRAVLDDERRAEFDKELLAWSDDHGIPS